MLLSAFRRIIFSTDLVGELLSKLSIQKKRIVIDFSSPNIAKTFHMGHLRSTVCGDFMQRIFRHAGHEVTSLNFLGDWGHQFGLLTVYWMDGADGRTARPTADEWAAMNTRQRVELLTNAYVAANRLKLVNPAFYQKARQLQLDMERHMISTGVTTADDVNLEQIRADDKDLREAFRLWREFRDSSVDYLQGFYARFGTKFDQWDAESYHVAEGARLTDETIQSDLCRLTRDEMWSVCRPEIGIGRETITLRKGDGLNLYMNRDLASIYARHRMYNADKYYYLVDYGQTNHFNQLRMLLRVRGDDEVKGIVTFGQQKRTFCTNTEPLPASFQHQIDLLKVQSDSTKEVVKERLDCYEKAMPNGISVQVNDVAWKMFIYFSGFVLTTIGALFAGMFMFNNITYARIDTAKKEMETRIDAKFDNIAAKFDDITAKLTANEAKFDDISAKLTAIEDKVMRNNSNKGIMASFFGTN